MHKTFLSHRLLFIAVLLSIINFPSISSERLSHIKTYTVFYGILNEQQIELAREHDLIILHAGYRGEEVNIEAIKKIRRPKKSGKRTLVIGYISLGENEKPKRGLRKLDPAHRGPVWRNKNGQMVYTEKGFRNWYLDERKLLFGPNGEKRWGIDGMPLTQLGQDGIPDENGKWNSYYVYVADPDWQKYMKDRLDFLFNTAGCDGAFFDTLDVASPWGHFKWMQKDMYDLILKIRSWYPEQIFIPNNGLFLFDQYGPELSKAVDGVMFESYLAEWDWNRNLATRQRWYQSNLDLIHRVLKPLNQKNDLFVFFLHYIQKKQKNAPLFYASMLETSQQLKSATAISTPMLKTMEHPFLLPKNHPLKSENLDVIYKENNYLDIKSWLSLKTFDISRLHLSITDRTGKLERPFIALYDHQIDLKTGRLQIPELSSGSFFLKLRLVDQTGRDLRIGTAKLNIAAQELQRISLITLQPAEKKIILSWPKIKKAQHYKIIWGTQENLLNYDIYSTTTRLELDSLINGQTYFFRIRAENDQTKGPWSEVFYNSPLDCTPPNAPISFQIKLKNKKAKLKWSEPPGEKAAGYYLYIDPINLGYGIPVKLLPFQKEWTVDFEKPGHYILRLSAIDASNNESNTIEKKIFIP